jgi:hypothetical protein
MVQNDVVLVAFLALQLLVSMLMGQQHLLLPMQLVYQYEKFSRKKH